jgi:hypothetical protein
MFVCVNQDNMIKKKEQEQEATCQTHTNHKKKQKHTREDIVETRATCVVTTSGAESTPIPKIRSIILPFSSGAFYAVAV